MDQGRKDVAEAWAWCDGRVLPADRTRVAANDRGLILGHAVFETVALERSQTFALRRHLERLRGSASVAQIAVRWSDDQLRQFCTETIEAAQAANAGPVDGRLRITVTAGPDPGADREAEPTLLVMVTPAPVPNGSASVALSPWPVNERSPLVGAKTTSRLDYVLAQADARARGADEAVLVNTRGALVEGSSSNLFVVVAGRLSTPSLSTGCLPGVTRTLVGELVEVAERDDLTIDDLRMATEAFLTSTTRGVQPITTVDGQELRSSPGPLTAAAAAALTRLRGQTREP